MRVKYTAVFAMEEKRHTAIHVDTHVRVINPKLWSHGMEGYVFKMENDIGMAWIQFGHEQRFAQVVIEIKNLEAI